MKKVDQSIADRARRFNDDYRSRSGKGGALLMILFIFISAAAVMFLVYKSRS